MPYTYQDVLTTDALRYKTFNLFGRGTATTARSFDDGVVIEGLNDSGGTIVTVRARAGTTPTGTGTGAIFDIHKNGTTIFTSTKIAFPTTAAGSATATGGTLTGVGEKVYNGDLLVLQCDDISNSAGGDVGVAVTVRIDEPNDD